MSALPVEVRSMSDNLIFMMGEFEAEFPADLMYAKNHMWAMTSGDVARFGFSAYAVRLLQDVYFLDWDVEAPVDFSEGQEIGSIESKKAESSLYAPGVGRLLQLNEALLEDPAAINTDKYQSGWLFEMTVSSVELLTAKEYLALLESVWNKTQRTIKGQLNE